MALSRREYDDKEYELKSYIADKFKDIQMQANSLKNVEDEVKVRQAFIKINDFIDEARRSYGDLEELSHEDVIEEEDTSDEYCGMAFMGTSFI